MYLNNQQLAGYLRRTRSNPEPGVFTPTQDDRLLDVFAEPQSEEEAREIEAYFQRTGGQQGTFQDVFVMDYKQPMYSYPSYTNTNLNNQQQTQQQPQQQDQNVNLGSESKDKSSKLPVIAFMGVVLVGGIYLYSKARKADEKTLAGFLP